MLISWVFFTAGLPGLFSVAIYIWTSFHLVYTGASHLSWAILIVPAMIGVPSLIMSIAWWKTFREQPSARPWGIAASVMNILAALFPLVLYYKFDHNRTNLMATLGIDGMVLTVGVLGLVAYSRRIAAPDKATQERLVEALPGDGTFRLLNQLTGLLIFGSSYGVYTWWLKWTWENGIPHPPGRFVLDTLWLILLGLVITLVHELGHTSVGLALGMKLRVFYVGPFQWRCQGGKWVFKFAPQEILLTGGVTGVVPATREFPVWRHVAMIVAGPLANLVTGLLAFWIVFSTDMDTAGVGVGLLALFGAFSLATFALNLIPVRVANLYSDGARIYQFVSGGPWADFNRVQSLVISSLVTSVRPRDYEIDIIERASSKLTRGTQGMLLRVWACHYWMDHGQNENAVAALKDAERVCLESVADLAASLHTVFVIGYALLSRDEAAVRQWWERMEAKKPTNFNFDYWMAKSAKFMMEGNLKEANEAWEKSKVEADKQSHAGAYEFDRDLCAMLHREIDKAMPEHEEMQAQS
jgi:hypothetical protein